MSKEIVYKCDVCQKDLGVSEPRTGLQDTQVAPGNVYIHFKLTWDKHLCATHRNEYMEKTLAELMKTQFDIDYWAMKLRSKIEEDLDGLEEIS